MTVYDAAHHLANAIKESEEFIQFRKLEKEVKSTPELKDMVEDFQKRQFELQGMQLQGQPIEEEKMKKLEELFSVINRDPKAAEYFQAELRFNQMMGDVSKILGDAMGIGDEE